MTSIDISDNSFLDQLQAVGIVQSILIFYGCSLGFGSSIFILDLNRLSQIQAVSNFLYALIQEVNQLVNCHKRYFLSHCHLPLEMLRHRHLPTSYASKTT